MKSFAVLSTLLMATLAFGAATPKVPQQRIVVKPAQQATTPFSATVELEQLSDQGQWTSVAGPFPAVVGRNGFAATEKKREGDGKSPSGTFAIGLVFGYEKAPTFTLKMPYRQATTEDFWVDDAASTQYNQWISGKPKATSWEVLRRTDELYSVAAVIEYNTRPIVPGNGSAIFFHIWRNDKSPTAGCVALAKENLEKLLSTLDPRFKPVVVLNP